MEVVYIQNVRDVIQHIFFVFLRKLIVEIEILPLEVEVSEEEALEEIAKKRKQATG